MCSWLEDGKSGVCMKKKNLPLVRLWILAVGNTFLIHSFVASAVLILDTLSALNFERRSAFFLNCTLTGLYPLVSDSAAATMTATMTITRIRADLGR